MGAGCPGGQGTGGLLTSQVAGDRLQITGRGRSPVPGCQVSAASCKLHVAIAGRKVQVDRVLPGSKIVFNPSNEVIYFFTQCDVVAGEPVEK